MNMAGWRTQGDPVREHAHASRISVKDARLAWPPPAPDHRYDRVP